MSTGRNDELIQIVRSAYIAARRRFDKMHEKNANYTPSPKIEGGDMEPYVKFIQQAKKYGFNPLQFLYSTMLRIFETGYSSDFPWIAQMPSWNAFDPNRLETNYEAVTRSAIATAFSLVDLNSAINAEIFGTSSALEMMSDNNEADPVVLLALHLYSDKKPSDELRRAAKTAYAVCPEVYDKELSRRGYSIPAFATFEDWRNE